MDGVCARTNNVAFREAPAEPANDPIPAGEPLRWDMRQCLTDLIGDPRECEDEDFSPALGSAEASEEQMPASKSCGDEAHVGFQYEDFVLYEEAGPTRSDDSRGLQGPWYLGAAEDLTASFIAHQDNLAWWSNNFTVIQPMN